ncbi:hypothetical protein Bpfe_019248, partial [Biomphalaria pfeifferi]
GQILSSKSTKPGTDFVKQINQTRGRFCQANQPNQGQILSSKSTKPGADFVKQINQKPGAE